MTIWLLRIFSLVALTGFAAAVWMAGPLVGFADTRPLEPAWTRATIIALAVAAVAVYYAIRFWQKRLAQKALEAAITGADLKADSKYDDREGEQQQLEKRMLDAVATLKRSSGKHDFLYEIPWYIIIGPPGAGKTTALVNSGLKFPLAGAGKAQAVPGVGGTRACDWWFTEDAVLIDTAGRYTTQDSDTEADKKGWLSFLSVLKRYRPRQLINGMILAVSLADLMSLDAKAINAHVIEIRKRLREIHESLRIEFPVYMLFTKADLIAGFMQYFSGFNESQRRQVWGATFQTAERGKNMIATAPAEFDALARRLSEDTAERLEQETDPAARIAIFGFAAQFGALKARVTDFLNGIFDPAASHVHANLRGFYFSSGTQEGTPVDQLLGTIGRSFGSDAGAHLSGAGKSFFLHDMLAKVILAESGWVSYDPSADRRAALSRYGAIGAIGVVLAIVFGVLALSFAANKALIASTAQRVAQYRTVAASVLDSAKVTDVDLENVIEPLEILRDLPVGYGNREAETPTRETFGLSQRERLLSASETAYREALERMFRSRLLLQLEQTILRNIADPAALYEPLKIYLMLGGMAPKIDDELIVSWMKRDWEKNRYPGVNNREGRADLETHLRAMLALDDEHDPLFELNRPLVEAAQRSLGQMTVADRASALLKSAAAATSLEDFRVVERGGPEAKLVFDTTDGSELSRLDVPGLYTYAGFHDFYLGALAGLADRLVDEQWVVGGGGEQGGVEQDLPRLGPELLDRYGKDFAAQWNSVLSRLKFKPMTADKPQYLALSAVASSKSPVEQLFNAVASETDLLRDPDPGAGTRAAQNPADLAGGLAKIGIVVATGKSQTRAGGAFANASGQVPGANVDAQFRPYETLVSGPPGERPIDSLTHNFHDIYQSLLLAASTPSQTGRVSATLQLQISALRANATRLPEALARIVRLAADNFEGDAAEASLAQLNKMLEQTVTGPCQKVIGDRFPFAEGSGDVPLADFAALFAPGGAIDRFFAQNLAPLADMSGQNWEWKQDTRLGRTLSKSTLKEFQLAAEIRDAFFPIGSSSPSVSLTFTPASLNADADMALLEVNGQIVQSYQTGSAAGTIEWPDASATESASLSLTPELPGRESSIRFDGPWALKRLLDAGTVTRNGDSLETRFVIGGRDVVYTIQAGPIGNPFSLHALSGFSCPTSF